MALLLLWGLLVICIALSLSLTLTHTLSLSPASTLLPDWLLPEEQKSTWLWTRNPYKNHNKNLNCATVKRTYIVLHRLFLLSSILIFSLSFARNIYHKNGYLLHSYIFECESEIERKGDRNLWHWLKREYAVNWNAEYNGWQVTWNRLLFSIHPMKIVWYKH